MGQPTVARRRFATSPSRTRRARRRVLSRGMGIKRRQDEYPLADFPMNIEILPRYPGDQISAVVSVSDSSKSKGIPRRLFLRAGYREPRWRDRRRSRPVRRSSSRCFSRSLPHERAQGAHAARAQHARAAQSVRHGGSVGEDEPQLDAERPAADRIDRRVGGGEIAPRGGARASVGVTFPTCSSASAMPRLRLSGVAQIVVREALGALQGRLRASA